MLRPLSRFVLASLIVVSLFSCVKDVDFEQAEDLTVSPTLEVSLVRFSEPANRFLDDSGIEQTTIRDSVRVEIFNDDFVVDNLRRAEFLFETTNSINRAFDAEILFLDDNDELQHRIEFGVDASDSNQELVSITEEIFENEAVEDLTATTKLLFSFSMQPSEDGSTLNEDSLGELKLRSKGVFYIDLVSPE